MSNPRPSWKVSGNLPLRYKDLRILRSDIGYRRKDYSDIRYNVGLWALQSDIGCSNIRLSPISLITDIGLSAHLWLWLCYCLDLISQTIIYRFLLNIVWYYPTQKTQKNTFVGNYTAQYEGGIIKHSQNAFINFFRKFKKTIMINIRVIMKKIIKVIIMVIKLIMIKWKIIQLFILLLIKINN